MASISPSSSNRASSAADLTKLLRSHEVAIAEFNNLASSRAVYQRNCNLFFRTTIQSAITMEQRITEIVSKRCKDFTKEFFLDLHTVAKFYYNNMKEQNELAKLGNTCLAAVQAYDAATESIQQLNAAELKFQDIINSPLLDAACRKIDSLAERNQLDSTLY